MSTYWDLYYGQTVGLTEPYEQNTKPGSATATKRDRHLSIYENRN